MNFIKTPNLPNQLTKKEIHTRLNKLLFSHKSEYLIKIITELYENTIIALDKSKSIP